ncbi:methyltransferase-like protein 22 [Cephus cinctus]|uniref:Methyltransferase-like protein 22 n=1 Tax=Cephus cinctus TaxID=211228 RepID=A0AAJ7BK65_CEPCN|nr:methyltransferase-like protein 22 [Cephus cinctus]XP_015587496.1 methyltransferase-like protein 22 [Cephus cinctus]
MHKVTSEIHTELENFSEKTDEGNVVSKYFFEYPATTDMDKLRYDEDGDLIVERRKQGTLLIEHGGSTELQLVGLQLWRGALLLADYILSNPKLFKERTVLELGSGVGLTSIVAGFFANEVICTDVDLGGILKLIERNFARNKSLIKSKFHITELNFLKLNWSQELEEKLYSSSIILAADVIYDDDITDGFVRTLEKLLNSKVPEVAYVALEKRYVFTIAELDSVAPMYEEFLRCVRRHNLHWSIEQIKIDFPKYFKYDRTNQLILMKIQRRNA